MERAWPLNNMALFLDFLCSQIFCFTPSNHRSIFLYFLMGLSTKKEVSQSSAHWGWEWETASGSKTCKTRKHHSMAAFQCSVECVCACVCERDRQTDRDREIESEKVPKWQKKRWGLRSCLAFTFHFTKDYQYNPFYWKDMRKQRFRKDDLPHPFRGKIMTKFRVSFCSRQCSQQRAAPLGPQMADSLVPPSGFQVIWWQVAYWEMVFF